MEYFMDTPFIVLIAGPVRTNPVNPQGRAWVRVSVVRVFLTTSICSIARFSYYSRSRRTSFRPFGYMAEGACREATDTSAAVKSLPGPYNGRCLSSSNREIPMHVTSGRWLYGFLLALTTTLLWGVLPIMLKQVLQGMDAATVSWYRMLSSGVVLLIWLGVRGQLPSLRSLSPANRWLLAVAVLGLGCNYVLYVQGLDRLTPGTMQLRSEERRVGKECRS